MLKVPKCKHSILLKRKKLTTLQVPGTVNLNEEVDAGKFYKGSDILQDTDFRSAKLEDWEYEEPKKRGDIVLNPQPTDSPNDPLNW